MHKYSMRFYEIVLTESPSLDLLYHGYSKLKYASMALASGKMAATSTQRFWADGRRRREMVDPDYKESYWMKGVSFTRDMRYAMSWGWVVIAVNRTKLKQRVKLVPFNWGYHMDTDDQHNHHKREREEFAIVKATPDNYIFPDNHEAAGEFDVNRFMSTSEVEGYIELTPIIEGIWLHTDIGTLRSIEREYDHTVGDRVEKIKHGETYMAKDMREAGYSVEDIIKHPKFKGYYSGGKYRETNFKLYPPFTPREDLPPDQ